MPWYKVSAEWEEQHYPLPTLDEEEEMSYFPRRNTKDRMDEAAVYRARTEAAKVPAVDLKLCEYDKRRKVLKLASEYMGMPAEFEVLSHHTGRKVKFKPVQPGDVLWDEDGWDGEQVVYRPVETIRNVDHMVIYHAW